jgi:NADPH-dependent ferric siderophore reductase
MTDAARRKPAGATGRREPPPFRRIVVRRTESLSPFMRRVTFGGDELAGLTVGDPAASVRLLLPLPGSSELVMPVWNGNEFLLSDGRRPAIRTFTPRRVDPDVPELDLDVVIHEGGVASTWALQAGPGSPAAVSGPGRGYRIDAAAAGFLLAGDETAIPAIGQLLEAVPGDKPVEVHIEVTHADARLALPDHPRANVVWHDLPQGSSPGKTLLDAIVSSDVKPQTRVWCAGEAGAMFHIRKHLFEERGMERARATVRGYWKRERSRED